MAKHCYFRYKGYFYTVCVFTNEHDKMKQYTTSHNIIRLHGVYCTPFDHTPLYF